MDVTLTGANFDKGSFDYKTYFSDTKPGWTKPHDGWNFAEDNLDDVDTETKRYWRSGFINYDGDFENITFEFKYKDSFVDYANSLTTAGKRRGENIRACIFARTIYDNYGNGPEVKVPFGSSDTQGTFNYLVPIDNEVHTFSNQVPNSYYLYGYWQTIYMFYDMRILVERSGNYGYEYTEGFPFEYIKIKSEAFWNIRNNFPVLITTEPAPENNTVEPYPLKAWRIDEYTNEGFPYIKLTSNIEEKPVIIETVPISLLDKITVRSKPHNINQDFIVTKMSIPLGKPDNTKFTLGKKTSSSFTQTTNNTNAQIANKIKDVPKASSLLKSAQDNATALMNAATSGFVTMVQENGHTKEIVISDSQDYLSAQNILRFNSSGLGFSTHGYEGPYGTAMTIDGSITADRITTGTMTADRMRGGQLILGGYDGKDGELILYKGGNNEQAEDSEIVVKLNKDGAFVAGELYGCSPEFHHNDEFNKDMKYFSRVNEAYIRFGVTATPGIDMRDPDEVIYANLGITDIGGDDNKWHHTLTIDTNNIWIGENDIPGAEGNFNCESITVNGHTMASCKITVVEGIDVQTASIETKDGTSINVVTNITTHEATYDFYRGFLYSDSGTPLDYD